jgi:parallel beta-helix repeat protein
MRKLLSILLLFTGLTSSATNYYVDNSGSDLSAGTSPMSAWQTLSKVNSASFANGDSILFKAGGSWNEKIIVNHSSIHFGRYGSGVDPIITGLNSVSSWTNLGGNIWQSASTVSTLSNCNMVVINGVNTAMGRYPNTGYITYNSRGVPNTYIAGTGLSGTPNWTGGQVVIRMVRWGVDRNRITSQSGDTLRYTSADVNGAVPTPGFGFFLQDDSLALDTLNEWYYSAATKKIKIYNTVSPTGVQVANIDTLVYVNARDNVTFDNIGFIGSNHTTFKITGSNNCTIRNCTINYSGLSGISTGSTCNYFTADNNVISNSNDVAIINDTSKYFTATNNTIKNTGVFAGMGSEFNANLATVLTTLSVKIGIRSAGAYANISYNGIDSTGYIGIFFTGDSVLVKNNRINTYCYILDDGGGIYSYSEASLKVWKKRIITGNIVLNGIGAQDGTIYLAGYTRQANGIYLDAANGNFDVIGNTVTNNQDGIFLNNSHEVNILGNTLYNNQYNILFNNYSNTIPMSNITVKNNIFMLYPDSVQTFPNSTANMYWLLRPDSIVGTNLPPSFVSDSNYFFNLLRQKLGIVQNFIGTGFTLPEWQAVTLQDLHSSVRPAFSTTAIPYFYYNATKNSVSGLQSGVHVDIVKNIYYNNYTISPFQSLILLGTILNITGTVGFTIIK